MKKLLYISSLLLTIVGYAQETRTITGKVIDYQDKLPIPGATVLVENTSISNNTTQNGVIESASIGTVTDIDGHFELKISDDIKSLRVTYVGYIAYTIEITSLNNYTVSLKTDQTELQEVVVTGYQKIEKRKLTSAISKVDMADIKQSGVASLDQLLIGQAAGVAVTQATGAPGAVAKIRVRGTASLSGSQDPLWVLDGIPIDNGGGDQTVNTGSTNSNRGIDLNQDDIESVTILKGPAAAVLYGSRAVAGAVIVTTKKGSKGQAG